MLSDYSNRRSILLPIHLALLALMSSSCDMLIRTSVLPSGSGEPNGDSGAVSLSADGRFAAFSSAASNLVANDNNNAFDVFVRDHQTNTTELISESISGGTASDDSGGPEITPDGRYVVFSSWADDLVSGGDANVWRDVFVHDRQFGTTELISVDSNELQQTGMASGGSISDNGRYISFDSGAQLDAMDSNVQPDSYLRDRTLGTTRLMSTNVANDAAAGQTFDSVISGNGQAVIFTAHNDDVVAGDTNIKSDIVWRSTGLLIKSLVSLPNSSAGGGQANEDSGKPTVSYSGQYVAFESYASNLVAGDTNNTYDVFLWDINLAASPDPLIRVSESSNGVEPQGSSHDPKLSADGSKIVFESSASNLQDTGATPMDTNGHTDIYFWEAGSNRLASLTPALAPLSWLSINGDISPDGSVLAYETRATNIGGDNNNKMDVYTLPSFRPTIASVSGDPLIIGQTTVINLTGIFSDDPSIAVTGNDVVSAVITSASASAITAEITISGTATAGTRSILIMNPETQLGLPSIFGSADSVDVALQP